MTSRNRILGAALATLALPMASEAKADDGAYPLVYGQRPMVLLRGMSQGEAAFSFDKPDFEGSDLAISLLGSVEYGITEELSVGVLAVPLALSPDVSFGQPVAHGTLRFIDKEKYEVGATARLTFPGENGGDLGIGAGLLGRFYLHKAAWLNVGAFVNVAASKPATTTIEVPFNLAVSFTRNLFFTLDTGFFIPEGDLDALVMSSFAGLGYTVGVERPKFDLFVRGGLPRLISAGTEVFDVTVQVGGRLFFQ
jgi:hypothetical protein